MTSSAQGWVLLGILGTMVAGMLALVAQAQASLKAFVGAKFHAVDARFDAVSARFDAVDRRLDDLDRDVQALSDRVFRDRP